MLRRYPGTDHITGIRAYAALSVVMIHSGAFRDFGTIGANLTDAGKYGVNIFFVVSGFSIAASYFKSGLFAEYIVRRIARIWPVYAAVLAAYAIAAWAGQLLRPGMPITPYNLLMHLSFLSGFDFRIANSIIGIEWTIPVEVFWYLLLPLVLVRLYRWRSLLLALIIAGAIGALQPALLTELIGDDGKLAAQWIPLRHGAYFLLGVLAYKWRTEPRDLDCSYAVVMSNAAAFAIPLAMASGVSATRDLVAVATAVLIAVYTDAATIPRHLLTNPLALFAGTVSYSVYLLHLLVLDLIQTSAARPFFAEGPWLFGLVVVVTVLLSTLTYLLIERPANRLGLVLAAKVRDL